MHTASALLEMQRRFLAALYDDDAAGPLGAIAGNGLEPSARLRIYRRSCNAIQTDALRTAYPAVLALVGETFFDQTAHGYRAACPSHAGNLQAFGEHFAQYLRELPALHALVYLPDVAHLEWLRQEVALAIDAPTLLRRACATRPADGWGRTVLHPAVRLLASPFPILTIWRYAMQPTPEPPPLSIPGERVMLWREDDQVAMAALDRASFACIEALTRGGTDGDACLAGRMHDPDFDFAACTQTLVERRLLVPRATHPFRKEPLS